MALVVLWSPGAIGSLDLSTCFTPFSVVAPT
jgi:hypothetical protein